jgi:threonylcarbamoyladenosine tRNA methylthiotransferase MtaB
MVGFPARLSRIRIHAPPIEEPLTYLHVFTYSARPGTPAAAMPNQVPIHIAHDRNRILQMAAEKKLKFARIRWQRGRRNHAERRRQ